MGSFVIVSLHSSAGSPRGINVLFDPNLLYIPINVKLVSRSPNMASKPRKTPDPGGDGDSEKHLHWLEARLADSLKKCDEQAKALHEVTADRDGAKARAAELARHISEIQYFSQHEQTFKEWREEQRKQHLDLVYSVGNVSEDVHILAAALQDEIDKRQLSLPHPPPPPPQQAQRTTTTEALVFSAYLSRFEVHQDKVFDTIEDLVYAMKDLVTDLKSNGRQLGRAEDVVLRLRLAMERRNCNAATNAAES